MAAPAVRVVWLATYSDKPIRVWTTGHRREIPLNSVAVATTKSWPQSRYGPHHANRIVAVATVRPREKLGLMSIMAQSEKIMLNFWTDVHLKDDLLNQFYLFDILEASLISGGLSWAARPSDASKQRVAVGFEGSWGL